MASSIDPSGILLFHFILPWSSFTLNGGQAAPSVVVIISAFFIPESPRWLVANSRDEEALAFLTRFHGNGDPNNPIVKLEWEEFKEGIQINGSDKR